MEQIVFSNVTLSFANNIIVESFDLSISKGEIVTFFGPSGCGKSSVMKMILGINEPKNGMVTIGGVSASEYRQAISYVPQDNELLPWLSVKGNVQLWAKNTEAIRLDVDEALAMVDMYQHAHKQPAILSGGMSRRTVVARGLIANGETLCFDEAMVGIEKNMRQKLLHNLRSYIKSNNITAIFISHDYEEAICLSDTIVMFTPPPTSISKKIDVSSVCEELERNNNFIYSQKFKDIYNEMMT